MSSRVASRVLALRGESAIAGAVAGMNVATYAYTIVCAQLLGPESYGAFASAMNLLLVISVLALGLQATGARRIASDPRRPRTVEAGVLRVGWQAALGLTLVCGAAIPLINAALRLDSPGTAALVAVTALPVTLMGAQAGVLQGERRWTALALVYLASGVPRVLIGTVLVWWHPTETWALAGMAITAWAPVLVGTLALHEGARRHALDSPDALEPGQLWRETLHHAQALLAFLALSNIDLVVARNQLDGHEAGLYAAGLIMTKAVLFLPQFVVVLAFPSLATTARRRRALAGGLALVALAGSACVLGAAVLAPWATAFVGGHDYSAAQSRLWLFAILGTLLAMLQVLVYSNLARQSRRSSLLIWAALAVVAAVGTTAVHTWPGLLELVLVTDTVLLATLLAVNARRLPAEEPTAQ